MRMREESGERKERRDGYRHARAHHPHLHRAEVREKWPDVGSRLGMDEGDDREERKAQKGREECKAGKARAEVGRRGRIREGGDDEGLSTSLASDYDHTSTYLVQPSESSVLVFSVV